MHLESMEMIIFPTKRDLDYPVQTKKRQIAANQQASPNHRRYIPEADLQTVSDKRSRFRHAPKATGSAPSPPAFLCPPSCISQRMRQPRYAYGAMRRLVRRAPRSEEHTPELQSLMR